MNIRIETQGFECTPAIAAAVRRQVASALECFEAAVASVDVFLKDLNGPKGGRDKQCVVRLRLYARTPIAVASTRSDLYAAIAVSGRRARRRVRRTLSRSRRLEKQQLRGLRYSGMLPGAAVD